MPHAPVNEQVVMHRMMLRFGRGATRLFRINSGMAWIGKIIARTRTTITLENPRAFHGATQGTSDLIGWHSVTITPDMIGKRVAIFVALEVKSATGRARPEQAAYAEAVRRSGGIAIIASDEEDVATALQIHDAVA